MTSPRSQNAVSRLTVLAAILGSASLVALGMGLPQFWAGPDRGGSARDDGRGDGRHEDCDDGRGNGRGDDHCVKGDDHCHPRPVCGNGIVEAGEECDDGNTSNNDGCLNSCRANRCGDGFVATSGLYLERCDTGGQSATCNLDCTPARCGDGITNPAAGELCDTGGQSATCNADCTPVVARVPPYCGDGIVTPEIGESCDPGPNVETPACNANCHVTACGDGWVNTFAGEECDDGNLVNHDGCSSSCKIEHC